MQSGATIDNDGLVNFIPTGNAESGTIPATMYANGAAVPTTGTGGSPTATFTITTTDPLQGSKSFVFTPGALGDGASIPFTVTRDCFGRALQVACSYEIATAASFADGDLTFYVKCPSGTIQQCVNFQFLKASGPMQFKALFQAEASGTQYYLLIHQATSNTAYGSVKLDSITSGPQQSTVIATGPVGEIIATGSLTPPSGFLYCNGDAVSRTTYAALFAAIGTTFGVGDGSTTFNVPDMRGLFLRGAGTQTFGSETYSATLGTKQNDATAKNGLSDSGHIHSLDVGAGNGTLSVYPEGLASTPNSVSTIAAPTGYEGYGYANITSSDAETRPANVAVAYHIRYQASTIASSEASDGRAVAARAYKNTTQTINAGTSSKIIFDVVAEDTIAGQFSLANSVYTLPASGVWTASGALCWQSSATAGDVQIVVVKNGSSVEAAVSTKVANYYGGVSVSVSFRGNAGDQIQLNCYAGIATTIHSDPNLTWFSIERVGPGSSIAFDGTVPFSGVGQGTAAKPPMTFFGDSNTGLFSPAADNIAMTTAGVERLRIDSNGSLTAVVASGSTRYPAYLNRCYVKFVGTGSIGANQTIQAEGNTSSVYKNGTGNFTVNFSTSLPDAHYAVAGAARWASGNNMNVSCASFNAGWINVVTYDTSNTIRDPDICTVVVVR